MNDKKQAKVKMVHPAEIQKIIDWIGGAPLNQPDNAFDDGYDTAQWEVAKKLKALLE